MYYTFVAHLGDDRSLSAINRDLGGTGEDIYNHCDRVLSWLTTILNNNGVDKWYALIEKQAGIHMHVVFQATNSAKLKCVSQTVNQQLRAWTLTTGQSLTFKPKRKTKGTWQPIDPWMFIEMYLDPKAKYNTEIDLGVIVRMKVGMNPSDRPTPSKRKQTLEVLSQMSATATQYQKIKRLCVKKGITNTTAFRLQLSTLWNNKICLAGGSRWLQSMCAESSAEIAACKKLSDYVYGQLPEEGPPANTLSYVLQENGFNVSKVCDALWTWVSHTSQKKNWVCFSGPPSTGKTLFSTAIASICPLTGMMNKNNENFPYTACNNKLLIWCEEGRLTNKTVEDFKSIACGTTLLVDIKCRPEQEPIHRTPVLMTTNNNPFLVFDGNSTTTVHEKSLRDRCIHLPLTQRLTEAGAPWFIYPTPDEMKEMITSLLLWGKARNATRVPDDLKGSRETLIASISQVCTETINTGNRSLWLKECSVT